MRPGAMAPPIRGEAELLVASRVSRQSRAEPWSFEAFDEEAYEAHARYHALQS